MLGNPLILELVQEILESNRVPEEVCAYHPELLWEVRQQLKRAQIVEARLEELFPSGESASAKQKPRFVLGGDLPQIPGYALEAVIGHGGMGVVFKARQLKLDRDVAIKMILWGTSATRHAGRQISARSRSGSGGAAPEHRSDLRDRGRSAASRTLAWSSWKTAILPIGSPRGRNPAHGGRNGGGFGQSRAGGARSRRGPS